MAKLKVCHIITKLELGGAQQNTLYTVSHLDKERFEPVLISGKGGILDAEAKKLSGITVHFTPHLIREARPVADALGFFSLWRLLKKEKPDIVHTHSSKAGILGRWAAWCAGVPVIIHTFHGFGFHDFQKKPVRAFYVGLEKLSAWVTDKLVAVSTDNIDKGLQCRIGWPHQYVLIRSGIDVSRYRDISPDREGKKKELGIGMDEKVVTTIGPFKPQKNLKDFIQAAHLLYKQTPSCRCRFLIIGDGEQRPELENLIKQLDLGEKVQLLGWRRDVPELLAITDVFAMTSLWEGLPRSVLEAMSSVLPVVANAVDGVKEVVRDGHTGFLTEPYHPESTADFLLRLLNTPDLARQMGKKGQELIDKQYDIHYMVKQQEDLYTHLMPKQ